MLHSYVTKISWTINIARANCHSLVIGNIEADGLLGRPRIDLIILHGAVMTLIEPAVRLYEMRVIGGFKLVVRLPE
jgi:hypothetical protein